MGDDLSVTIRDLENFGKTEFTAALERDVAATLERVGSLGSVVFERKF
jgi:hypothetical protein